MVLMGFWWWFLPQSHVLALEDTTLKLDAPGFEFGLFNYVYMNNLLNSMSLIFINY